MPPAVLSAVPQLPVPMPVVKLSSDAPAQVGQVVVVTGGGQVVEVVVVVGHG